VEDRSALANEFVEGEKVAPEKLFYQALKIMD